MWFNRLLYILTSNKVTFSIYKQSSLHHNLQPHFNYIPLWPIKRSPKKIKWNRLNWNRWWRQKKEKRKSRRNRNGLNNSQKKVYTSRSRCAPSQLRPTRCLLILSLSTRRRRHPPRQRLWIRRTNATQVREKQTKKNVTVKRGRKSQPGSS